MYNWVASKGGNGYEAIIENIYNIKQYPRRLKCYELYENISRHQKAVKG